MGNKVTTTDYILHGKLVTHMKVSTKVGSTVTGTQEMHFFYDAQSHPAIVEWNGQRYTYVHNLQGDIVAIVDSSGAKVVEYKYDAWGRDIGCTLTSDIGELNPFRYRGYVYDEETELYYLRSRYYNAGIERFVCADAFIVNDDLSSTGNLYAYSKNSPIVCVDFNGTRPMDALSIQEETKAQRERSFTIIRMYYKTRKRRFNNNTVHVYREGEGRSEPGKLNLRVYNVGEESVNVHISNSLSINSKEEMNDVLDVFMNSPYYSEKIFGSRDFMRAQWVAHNLAYDALSKEGYAHDVVSVLSGSADPAASAKELDIRSVDNFLARQLVTYALLLELGA